MIRAKPRRWTCAHCRTLNAPGLKKCGACAIRRATKRTSLSSRADKLWADYIKRPGKCFRCGKTEGLQAAHIIGRAQRVTRWHPHNGLCLCHDCHRKFDTYKIDRGLLVLAAIGAARYAALTKTAQGVWDMSYDRVLRELKAL